MSPESDCARARQFFLVALGIVALFLRPYRWAEVPAVFWEPISYFRLFSAPPFGSALLWLGTIGLPILCFLSAWRPHWISSVSLWLVGWALLPYGMNFGKVDHFFHMAALLLLADAVTQVILKLKPRERDLWLNAFCQFGQYAIVLMYGASGLRKLIASGPAWAFSNNMEIMLRDGGAPLGVWLAGLSPIPLLLATGALLLELFSPLALLSPLLAAVFVPSWALMHLSIYLFMGPNFLPHVICFFVFYPYVKNIQTSASAKNRSPLFFALLGIYTLLAAHQVAYKLDSWPLSSFPMYETNYGESGVKRYFLVNTNEVSVPYSSFPPFLPATLERSLRKNAEKQRLEILKEKITFLELTSGLGPLRLRETTWETMENFDPSRPDKIEWIYPAR